MPNDEDSETNLQQKKKKKLLMYIVRIHCILHCIFVVDNKRLKTSGRDPLRFDVDYNKPIRIIFCSIHFVFRTNY